MKLTRKKMISKDEIILGLRRYASLSIGIINAFLLPFVFDRVFDKPTFSFLIIILGVAPYLNLLDFGFTKPIMSDLRKKFLNRFALKGHSHLLSLYLVFTSLVFLIYLGFSIILYIYKADIEISLIEIFLYCLFNSIIISFVFIKQFFWAIDKYQLAEKIDLLIRVCNLIFFLTLFFCNTISLPLVIINILLICILIKSIKTNFNSFTKVKLYSSIFNELIEYVQSYKNDAKNNLFFSINETLIYSSGILILPFFLNDNDIIKYGIFIRLFASFALVFRALSDIKIHAITRSFFNDKKSDSLKQLKFLLIISLCVAVCESVFFYFFNEYIFEIIFSKTYIFSTNFILSLALFIISNSLQHPIGTFMVYSGNHFLFLKRISFRLMISILTFNLIFLFIFKSLDYFLIINSSVYFIGTLFYLKKIKNE